MLLGIFLMYRRYSAHEPEPVMKEILKDNDKESICKKVLYTQPFTILRVFYDISPQGRVALCCVGITKH